MRAEVAGVRAADPAVTNCHRLLIDARYLYTETRARGNGRSPDRLDKRGRERRGAHVGAPWDRGGYK